MSRLRRALSTCLVATTLVGGLAPLTARGASATDPDGTVTLASGASAIRSSARVIAQTTAGVLFETDDADNGPLTGLFRPASGGAPVSAPWLLGLHHVGAVGSMAVGTRCEGTCHVEWHTLPSGPSGTSTTTLSHDWDLVAASPDGWVESELMPDGAHHLVRVTASTEQHQDLGVPGNVRSSSFSAVSDGTGMAVRPSGVAMLTYTRWDSPGQYSSLPLVQPGGFTTLWQTLDGAVLYEQDTTNPDRTTTRTLVRRQADGTQSTSTPGVLVAAAMTASRTAWSEGTTVLTMPATGGAAGTAVDMASWRSITSIGSDGIRFTYGLADDEPGDVAGLWATDGTAPDQHHVYLTPLRPLHADHVAVGGGRVAWSDDSEFGPGFREASVAGSTTPTLGTASRLPVIANNSGYVSVSGRRTVFNDNAGYVKLHVLGQAGVTVVPGEGAPLISGTRVALGSHVLDLVTGRSTALPDGSDATRIWGRRVAYRLTTGEVRLRDLVTGADSQLLPPSSTWVAFDLRGDTFAWHDGQLHLRDLRTDAISDVPGTSGVAHEVDLSGSRVGYVEGEPRTLHVLPLSGTGPETTIGPLRYAYYSFGVSTVSMDGDRVGWLDPKGAPKVTQLPHVAEAPRHLGNPFAPTTFTPGNGPWRGEWVFTKPLPACTVTIRSGATVIRTLGCATTNGSALATWDGTDAAARAVASGSYTWTVTASDADGAALAEDGTSAPITGTIAVHGVSRLAGTDRFATSAAVSRATYAAGAPVAYVANGDTFPDALSGAPAAGRQGGPVLLTRASTLPGAIASELARLKPRRIVILGSTGAVSAAVATKLNGYTPGTVTRLAGADRYATSAAVSRATNATGVPVAYVANGQAFPDALSGAPAAAHLGGPVLLTRSGSLPSAIAAELARLKPRRIVVLGSTGAVSATVATRLKGYTPGTVTRLAGADRYATAATVSKATCAPGVPVAYVANGLAFPDALSGAPAAGRQSGPVLLLQAGTVPSAIATELTRLRPHRIVVLGSTGAVSAATLTRLAAYTG